MKLKIGDSDFTLNSYLEIDNKGYDRPYVFFDIDAKRDEVENLALVENQTFFITFDNSEVKDLSNKCVLFGKCTNDHNIKCQLVMENYSDIELKDLEIKDLLEV